MSLRSEDIGGLRRDKRWGLSGSTVMYSHPFDTFWMMRFRNYFYAFENNLYRPHLKKSLSRSFSLNFFLRKILASALFGFSMIIQLLFRINHVDYLRRWETKHVFGEICGHLYTNKMQATYKSTRTIQMQKLATKCRGNTSSNTSLVAKIST